jgi:SAM-dependent methyltransferase
MLICIFCTPYRIKIEGNILNESTEHWFLSLEETLETAYLKHEEPWKQSGFSGPENRWISLRKPIADCVDKSGSFLDIGCANGYLLECCLKWTAERNIEIIPYGLDISEKLIELAKRRLPQYSDNLFVGNALTWLPPRRFDFVRTELVYVPAEYENGYIKFLLQNHLNPDGKLLISSYGEGLTNEEIERGIIKGSHVTSNILQRLNELGFHPVQYKDGYDPVKGRKIRVAILKDESSG